LVEKIKAERAIRAAVPKSKQTKKKASPKVNAMETLESVLEKANDWMDAQEAFRACGVTDGTDTDRIEELYAELRKLDKNGRLNVQRHGDYDMLKLKGK
jgi:type I restriction enzyme S subunit